MTILKFEQVQAMVGVSRSTLWRWERNGGFPSRIRLGPASVGWDAAEVEAWLRSRPRGMAG